MKKYQILILLPLIILSCGHPSEVTTEDLSIQFGVWVHNEDEKPYSGKVKKYKERDGKKELVREFSLVNGLPDGEYISYYKGKITSKEEYKSGVLDGKCVYYNDDGEVSQTIHYKEGKKVE